MLTTVICEWCAHQEPPAEVPKKWCPRCHHSIGKPKSQCECLMCYDLSAVLGAMPDNDPDADLVAMAREICNRPKECELTGKCDSNQVGEQRYALWANAGGWGLKLHTATEFFSEGDRTYTWKQTTMYHMVRLMLPFLTDGEREALKAELAKLY